MKNYVVGILSLFENNLKQFKVIPNENIIYTNFDNWFFYVTFGL